MALNRTVVFNEGPILDLVDAVLALSFLSLII